MTDKPHNTRFELMLHAITQIIDEAAKEKLPYATQAP